MYKKKKFNFKKRGKDLQLHLNIMCYFIYFIFLPFQRTPSFLQGKTRNVDPSHARPLMIGLAKDACPFGTVPIRRATKEDLVASKLLLNNFQPQAASFNNSYVSSSLFIFNLKQHLLINVLFHKNARIYTKLRCSYIVRV